MELKKILLIILCLMMLTSSSCVVAECNDSSLMLTSDPVWSDTFSDNASLDDWVVLGYNPNTGYNKKGEFEIIDGALVSTGNDSLRNAAFHNNSIAFGTWSFDIFLQNKTYEDEGAAKYATEINLISSIDFPNPSIEPDVGLRITILHNDFPLVYFYKGVYIYEQGQGEIIYYSELINKMIDLNQNRWFHFDISRYPSGMLYAYIDGSEIFYTQTDVTISTSKIFSYFTVPGGKLDNVTIYDSVVVDYHAPIFLPLPVDQEVELETDFRYDVNATDDTDILWSIDDTENFEIDNDGVITNLVALDLGTYDLKVTVADEFGNTKSAEFTLTVAEASWLPVSSEMFLGTLLLIPIVRRKFKR